jgi:hypothetical protein
VYVLLTLTGFVLLLACANIANLLLARGAQRQREMSVRHCAGRGAGPGGTAVADGEPAAGGDWRSGRIAAGVSEPECDSAADGECVGPGPDECPMDWGVFAFAAAVTLVTGVVFGLAPAWLAARSEVSSSLKESAQTTTRRRKGLGGKAIVAFQIALSTLLVVGAGLFLRTLIALNAIDVGFRTDHLVLFEVDPPGKRYEKGLDVQLHQEAGAGVCGVAGGGGCFAGTDAYIADNMSNSDFIAEGETDKGDHSGAVDFNMVGNTFFETLGIPMIAGGVLGRRIRRARRRWRLLTRRWRRSDSRI